MTEISKQIAGLSPEKRKLLEMLLVEEGLDVAQATILPHSKGTNKFVLSFAQQRLWFLDQLEHGSPIYNIPIAVRLSGTLNVEALRDSLNQVIRRHEILRTTFIEEGEQPLQVISSETNLDFDVVDLSLLPDLEKEAETKRLTSENAHHIFDLTKGPLLKSLLIRLNEKEHIFLLTMHHIIADGWSIGVLINEIQAFYNAQVAGNQGSVQDRLPELPIQYADYAVWQRNWLQGEILENQSDYWKKQLGGDIPVLALPSDHMRPSIMSTRGATQSFELSIPLSKKLLALSRHEDVTTFMLMLSAFQAFLFHFTGQEDISVGTPIANRKRGEVEELIGFFANTLVLRTDLSGDPSFRDLLKRVKEVTLGAYDHQDIPFEMLVDILHPARDLSYSPLFQVMFSTQNATTQVRQLLGLKMENVNTHNDTAKYDLTVVISESPDHFSGTWEYNADLFKAETINRMIGSFIILLEDIATEPDKCISSLVVLTREEQHQLLESWNNTAHPYPIEKSLHQLFEEQVGLTPDSAAVYFEGEQISYRELNGQANQLAHALLSAGVGPNTLIGLYMERSVKMIVGLLAILKAGGAYLPLDPVYPKDRLANIMEDAQVSILLTQEMLLPKLPKDVPFIFCLDKDWATIALESDANPSGGAAVGDLAYVIYTSGSTGRPKGVMIEHRSAINLWAGLTREIYSKYPGESLRISLNAPLLFDASVQEWVMLLSGHCLYIIPQEVRLDGERLLEYIRNHQLDVLDCVPTQLKFLLSAGLLDGTGWTPRAILPGGEAIDEPTWKELCRATSIEFFNMYGPTECTVDSTICWVNRHPEKPSIGQPIANAKMYVLDRHLHPVPVGVPGELFIGGDGVGRGYLNRPELTAEKFIPNPFDPSHAGRLYRTGDLVRYLPDGHMEFLGRADFQVKVRGFRVELGEIEAILKRHPAVHEAVVLAREDAPGEKQIVAYVTIPGGEKEFSLRELRSYLKQHLPDYMIPSFIVILDVLPLTPNGKLDRKALPVPEVISRGDDGSLVAPRTAEEEILANIWRQCLAIDIIGVNDNFFELGGHSLLATQVVSRIRATFKIELPLRCLFETPTIAGLAESVRKAQQEAQGVVVPPIHPVSRDEELPLSFAQERLWFIDQFEPGVVLYNIPSAIRLKGRIDRYALENSLNEIVRRHEILRTTISTINGRAVQVITPDTRIDLPVLDLSSLPEEEREGEARRLSSEEPRQSFDLSKGPLIRVLLIKLAEFEHIILMTMHHIISDGWSTSIFVRELVTLYPEFLAGKPALLPDLTIQYADFAKWQREWLKGEVLETQLTYWKEQLRGVPPVLELPTDRPRPAVLNAIGSYLRFDVPAYLTGSIDQLSKQSGVTLFMTLLAAFKVLLYRYTGQTDISVGTAIANRNRVEIEPLIGFFVNTLVLRTDLSGEPGFADLLKREREVALGAFAHQDLPFEILVNELQPERNTSHTPLFQVMFLLQNIPEQHLELPDLSLSQLDVDTGVSPFDLTLILQENGAALSGAIQYNSLLFDVSTVERIAGHYLTLLDSIVSNPTNPISILPIMSKLEVDQILGDWNDTYLEFSNEKCVFQKFEENVERMPEALAVVFGNVALSYAQLNEKSNKLAHYLRKLGIGPEKLVAICVERSVEMLVGMLGVMKAGGAYLPIDPAHPQERIAFILSDADVKVLLTQESLLGNFPVGQRATICLDRDWSKIEPESGKNLNIAIYPENLAYVIYTSGSTGRPKGVLIQHLGLTSFISHYLNEFDLKIGSRVLQFMSFSFDASIPEMFTTWLAGGVLFLTPREAMLSMDELAGLLREERINWALLPPSILAVLPWEEFPDLKLIEAGGDKLPVEVGLRWQKGRRLYNGYGPTEATIGPTLYKVEKIPANINSIPIGRPVGNMLVYILDNHLQPVPVGVPGEIFIGGIGIARGYLNRPDLSAEKFIPNPYIEFSRGVLRSRNCHFGIGEGFGTRLYRTGDLARYLPDGNIEFLGRVDFQVKVRGFRIELGEIEAVLAQLPSVREGFVMLREDTPAEKQIVAYLSLHGEKDTLTVNEIRVFLKQHLPDYMIPSIFMMLDSLPLTPHGKVDRRALPVPEGIRPDLDQAFLAPRTPAEATLAAVWSQVLGLEKIGVNDNFFELGGDSILSIQVIARANQAGVRITPRQLFEHPTIAGLASIAAASQTIQAEQAIVQGPVSLIPIQSWFFENIQIDRHHFNQALLLEVNQALEPNLLQATIESLISHHDALRLRFKQTEEGWQQFNAGLGNEIPFTHIELVDLPKEEQIRIIEETALQAQESLNLENGPLIKVIYISLENGTNGRLLIVIHHMAVDGVSWRILLEDLQSIYLQLVQGRNVQLPPKTTSYRQWAERLETYAQSQEVLASLEYWLRIEKISVPDFPVDFPNGQNNNASARSVKVSLGAEETQVLLQDVPAKYGTEINDVLLTALVMAFGAWSSSRTFVFEIEGHGREDIFEGVDLSRTVGWFTDIYPLVLSLRQGADVDEALKSIKEQVRQVPRRGFDYGVLRYISKNEDGKPLLTSAIKPPVSFNYLGQVDRVLGENSPFRVARESSGPAQSLNGKRLAIIEINGAIARGQLNIDFIYSENLHKRSSIELIVERFLKAIRKIIAHSQSTQAGVYTPSDFPLAGVDQVKLDKILGKMNQSKKKG